LTNVSEEVSAGGACDEAVRTSETALRNIPEGHHVHTRVETANNFRSRTGWTVEGSRCEIFGTKLQLRIMEVLGSSLSPDVAYSD
jgi:hypothetical protein